MAANEEVVDGRTLTLCNEQTTTRYSSPIASVMRVDEV